MAAIGTLIGIEGLKRSSKAGVLQNKTHRVVGIRSLTIYIDPKRKKNLHIFQRKSCDTYAAGVGSAVKKNKVFLCPCIERSGAYCFTVRPFVCPTVCLH